MPHNSLSVAPPLSPAKKKKRLEMWSFFCATMQSYFWISGCIVSSPWKPPPFLPRNAIALLVCSAYPGVKGKTQLTCTSIRNDESLTETDALSSQRDTHKLAAGSHCSHCRWDSNNGRAAAVWAVWRWIVRLSFAPRNCLDFLCFPHQHVIPDSRNPFCENAQNP